MQRNSSNLPSDLASAQHRIETWRADNDRRRMLPEWAWAEAVGLARTHGINRVSEAMRLSHKRLRARVERMEDKSACRGSSIANAARPKATSSSSKTSVAPHFVALNTSPLNAPALLGGMSVELTDGSERRMTIRGVGHAEVVNIIAAFCAKTTA